MPDPRITNHARILVRYSIATKKGETVGVNGGVSAQPLIAALYEELIRVGAFPVLSMMPEGLAEFFYREGQQHHFTTLTPYQRACANTIDKTIGISSQSNTRALSAVDPKRQSRLSETMKPISDIVLRKPWVLTLFPTSAYAQDAEMSLHDFEDFVYGAIFADQDNAVAAWENIRRKQERLIGRLRGADEIRIVGPEADLKLSVKGRRFVNSAGERNMPSGEVFAGPVETSAEGYIRFDYPICAYGREISGVMLVFRKGVAVEATAEKNEDFLRAMLDSDKGARRLGELGIGTNTRIQRFIKNILFDEKIGGTIHLALGRSPSQTNGRNKSAIHWDLIKDLRKGGILYVNGRVFQRDGKFVG